MRKDTHKRRNEGVRVQWGEGGLANHRVDSMKRMEVEDIEKEILHGRAKNGEILQPPLSTAYGRGIRQFPQTHIWKGFFLLIL